MCKVHTTKLKIGSNYLMIREKEFMKGICNMKRSSLM